MNRLKFLRTEKKENLYKIAKFLNVSIQTVSNYENEKREMTPDTIIKLAEYFGVSTDYLLGKSDIRNYDEDEKEFRFAFHKETEGMTDEEIKDALRFYKEMKNRIKEEKKDGSK